MMISMISKDEEAVIFNFYILSAEFGIWEIMFLLRNMLLNNFFVTLINWYISFIIRILKYKQVEKFMLISLVGEDCIRFYCI